MILNICQRQQIESINQILGTSTLYNLVSEECSELSQAVMKLSRIEGGDPLVEGGSNKALLSVDEEIADVIICIERLVDKLQNQDRVKFLVDRKINRTIEGIRSIVSEKENSLKSQEE